MDIPITYYIHLWMIALFVVVLLVLALEIGFRIGLKNHQVGNHKESESSKIVLSSLLLILGLILAFTFAAGVSRYEARKAAVIEEANAIGTLFYYANFAQEPERSNLRNKIYQYAQTRTTSHLSNPSINELKELIARSAELQDQVVYQTSEVINNSDKFTAFESALLKSMNEVLNAHSKRSAVVGDILPLSVIVLQIFIATLSLGFAGYMSGLSGQLSRLQVYALAFCLSLIILTAQDFDRSLEGFIRVSHHSIDDAVDSMSSKL
ncbi:MAG: hypothetical protein AAGB35_07550 [Pseudomonadota bacterium]